MKNIQFYFLITFFFLGMGYTQSQDNLVDVDTDRLFQVSTPLVKNLGLTVIFDKAFEDAGFEMKQIGFRESNRSGKNELYIQFHGEEGVEMEVGAILFGANKLPYWESTMSGVRQPLQRNLFSIRFDFDHTLERGSVLQIWAKKPIQNIPYQMWEWMDEIPSKWLFPEDVAISDDLDSKDNPVVYGDWEVQKKPQFLGGEEAKKEFLTQHISYPEQAIQDKLEGTVVVHLVVKANGEVGEIGIVRDIGAGCGDELMRVVQMMPNWIAGKRDGKEVDVRINIMFTFKL